MFSKYKTKYLDYKANKSVIQLYEHFDSDGLNNALMEFEGVYNQFLNDNPSTNPKDFYKSLTKAQLKTRIGSEDPKSLKIIPPQELKRIRDTKTNDFNGFLMACQYDSRFCVKMMLDSKCPQIYNRNASKSSGLHIACELNHIDIVEYILKNEPNEFLKMQNKKGRTPLHCAIATGNVKVALRLIKYIENLETREKYLSIKDNDGNTPNDLAYKITAFKCKSPPGTPVPPHIFKKS